MVLATACAAAGNCWCVRAASESPGESVVPVAAIASATAAMGLAVTSFLAERHAWNWEQLGPGLVASGVVELPGLVLLFWLMGRMTATRMSTRFLIAPLMANIAGLILLRANVSVRDGLGLLLIALGAGWLLFAKEDEPGVSGLLKN